MYLKVAMIGTQMSATSDLDGIRVFLSSAIRGHGALRQRVADLINQTLAKAWLFEGEPASGRLARKVYLDGVKRCEIFLAVLLDAVSPGVREEIALASQLRKCRLIFLSATAPSSVREFLEALPEAPKYMEFKSESQLLLEIGRSLNHEFARLIREGLNAAAVGPAVSLPAVPSDPILANELVEKVLSMVVRSAGKEPVVIVGQPGIGKSSLAAEVARRRVTVRSVVWWIHANDVATAASDMETLAVALGIVAPGTVSQATAVSLLREWLATNPDWLLVFDEVTDTSAVSDFLPASYRGEVIITTRNEQWVTGNVVYLDEPIFTAEPSPVDALNGISQRAREMMSLLAFFSTSSIPIDQIFAAQTVRPFNTRLAFDDASVHEVIRELVEHRLVVYDGNLSVEGQIQDFMMRTMTVADARRLLHRTAILIEVAFPYDPGDPSNWLLAAALHPHAETLLDHCDRLHVVTWTTVQLLIKLSKSTARTRLGYATRQIQRALDMAVTRFGSSSPVYADAMNTIGLIRHTYSQMRAASRAMDEAMRITSRGGRASRVLSVLNGAGMIAKHSGDLQRARQLLTMVTNLEREAGSVSPRVLANLAGVLLELRDQVRARALLSEAESLSDLTNPIVVLNNLGNWLVRYGDANEGLKLHRKLLDERLAVYGPESPTTAISQNGFAMALQATGDHQAAIPLFESAIRIEESSFGPLHLRAAICYRNLSISRRALALEEPAREALTQARSISEMVLGRNGLARLCMYW
jgi:tetratricopeptide (TPR) repeat protein